MSDTPDGFYFGLSEVFPRGVGACVRTRRTKGRPCRAGTLLK